MKYYYIAVTKQLVNITRLITRVSVKIEFLNNWTSRFAWVMGKALLCRSNVCRARDILARFAYQRRLGLRPPSPTPYLVLPSFYRLRLMFVYFP